jgi:hypothetical protein
VSLHTLMKGLHTHTHTHFSTAGVCGHRASWLTLKQPVSLTGEYWRLADSANKPPGVMGWWPSRAVTFLENHDTGSTQGHWRFPAGRELEGYAYLLTHPGTPSVFFDHLFFFGDIKHKLRELIQVRGSV